MLTIAGYDLPEVVHEDAETVTCGGTRIADGARVRVRFLRDPRPGDTELAGWRSSIERLRGAAGDGAERLLALHPFGAADAIVLDDDGKRPLESLLRDDAPFAIERALAVARATTEVVARMHRNGGVHGRISAAAVWVHPSQDDVVLVDVVPDLRYRAPEQWGRARGGTDARSDLYAIGVLLHHLLGGQPPWTTSDLVELAHAHAARKPADLRTIRPELPDAVAAIVNRLLAKSVADRYQTAHGLLVDLRALEGAVRAGQSTDAIELGAADRMATFALPDKLYGRAHEIETLRMALDRSRWGRSEPVLLRGAPGIGKSALAAELRAETERERGYFIAGKFDQYKRNVPYSAVVQAFTALVHRITGESAEEVASWREKILEAVGSSARVLVDIVPELELLTGPLPAVASLGPTETRNRFNAAFREFIRVFGRPDRPLVLLLDDLQWADSASVSLFITLAGDTELRHLLLLGAYRDSEAGGGTLVTSAAEELRDAGIASTTLVIGPIALADTIALIADTVTAPPARCAELGALVHGMTGGNPFFVRQFLRALHDDGLLWFDPATNAWRWELERVRSRGYSENVVELMAARLAKLSPDAATALRVASCVGATFAPRIVAAALELPEAQISAALAEAADDGLIDADASVSSGSTRFRFVHDRAQQAAYALIPAAERSPLRRKIGRVMRELLSPTELDDALFEVVTNLSEGLADVHDPVERQDLAVLSLAAGQRARASLAYEDARTFLQTGLAAIDGLGGEGELAFELRSALFECTYLTSRFKEADALFDRLLKDAPGVMERAQIYNTKILIDTSQDRSEDAVRLGVESVRELGVVMPVKPGPLSVLWGLLKVSVALRGRSPDALLDLPRLTDPRRTAAVGLLLRIGPAAYFNNPGAFVLSSLNIVYLSLRHGNTPGSSFGYVIYAMVLGAKLGNAKRGQQFGRLAVALSDRIDTAESRPKVHMIFGGFVNYWSESWQSSIRILADGIPLAAEAGDLQYGGYCRNCTLFLMHAFGVPLEEVVALGDRYEPFVTQANETFTVDTQALMRQRARALVGRTESGASLTGESFDEPSWVQRVRDSSNLTTLGYYQTVKLQLALLFRDFEAALRIGEEGYANREALLSQIQTAELYFYYGLALAAVVRTSSGTRARRSTLAKCRKLCARLARDCAANYEPWHLLLEAECSQGGDDALSMYDRAIDSARRHQQPNVEGLAAELAARSQLAAGRKTVAQSYLRDAVAAYGRWQATAKVTHLVREFAELLPEQALTLVAAPAPPRRQSASIGLEAAVLAVHALADETALDRLLERLLKIAIEGAGAESGQVILAGAEGELAVEAVADAEHDHVQLVGSTPLAAAANLCVPVVQTVARRRAAVIIADAVEDAQFGNTPDVRMRHPRSIACIPILLRDRLLGVLYVENNLARAAFSPERVRLLTLMASELAVAVERVRLAEVARESSVALSDALRRVGRLEKSREHLGKFVPRSVQRIIDANPDAPALEKRERDVSILFLDIEGYTRLTESLPRERLDWLVRTYFSRFLDIVHEHRGEINETAGDGLMILFQDDVPSEHAANACRAAVAIRRAARELNASFAAQLEPVMVNIGINSGAALVGSTRLQGSGDARWTFTATGSVTNVAARLGAFATGGSIVVSDATATRIGPGFVLESLGPQRLKNVSEPVVLFRISDEGVQT